MRMSYYRPDLPVPLGSLSQLQIALETPLSSGQGPASLPVTNPTKSFWLHPPSVNPLAKEGSEGPLTKDADICIIGSGITGVSAAYHLSRFAAGGDVSTLRVVILEARDFCSGATGRNGGHLTPVAFLDFRRKALQIGEAAVLRQIALENHTVADFLQIIKCNGLEEAVDLVNGSHITLLFTDHEVDDAKADYEAAKNAGANLDHVEWYSKEDMACIYGTNYAGIKIPGHNLWPMKLVTELYRIAKSNTLTSSHFSLKLHTNTPVTSITPSTKHNRRWNLETPRGTVSCRTVLHATNGYASHLLPHMTGPEGIIPTRGQIIATRANVKQEDLTRSSWEGNEGFEYWFPRPLKDKNEGPHPLVILGGARERATGWELYVTDDSSIDKDVSKTLREFLPAVYPGKFEEGKASEMEWTGIMGYTKLNDPFVGPVLDPLAVQGQTRKFDGQFICAGYTGHGMPRAYACAEAVTQLMLLELAGKPRDNWTPPEWLPMHYLTWMRGVREKS